jgi:hypothetical protein
MRRLAVFAVAASLLGTLAGPAQAAGDCPDGDWFCDPAVPEQTPPAPDRPPGGPDGARRRLRPYEPPPPDQPPFTPPPPPGYYDDGEVRIDVPRVEPARRRHRRGFREWGLNLHAVVGLMGNDSNMSPNADMNGLGGALRFRPIPHIAIEGAVELLWGTDYNGYQRFEDALMFNGLFFANPRSAVQLYGIAGFGFGAAYLDSGLQPDGQPVLRDETYRYAGGQLGLGVEGRVTRHFALGADLIGFLRWRTDRHAAQNPEFIDPATGRTTNTSGGGLLRLGATFYW